MKLLIVRHGDPDYSIDGLTAKGKVEAELLSHRLKKERIDGFYCSPLGRARLTAAPTEKALGRQAKILPFLREFDANVRLPYLQEEHCCWDILPSFLQERREIYSPDGWREVDFVKAANVGKAYDEVCCGLDTLLAEHGYERNGLSYRALRPNHDTLVLVCHFGVTAVMMSHLLNCSPYSLFQNCVTLPTSVTTVFTEEREEGVASMRCCGWGDVSHLYAADEEPAFAARFCECFTDDTRHH